jgi:hypothetical protein
MHPHALGPYAFDPNLVAQGIPPDDRIDFHENIYGPPEGTPMPADPNAGPTEPPPVDVAPTGPAPGPADPAVAPSAFHSSGGPSVAAAQYDPDTGRFITADGQVGRQSNLAPGSAMSWQQLLPTA